MLSFQAALVALALGGGGETVLYDFYTDWCGPCRAMSPLVHQLAEQGYPVKQVNAERQPELAQRFGVDCYPTFVMVAEGREVARRSGQCGIEELRRMFDAVPERQARIRGQSPDEHRSAQSDRGERMPAVAAADPLRAGGPALRSTPTAGPRATAREALLARLLAASVRLKIEDPDGFSYGTGTIVHAQGDEALILTCGHVFRDSRGKGRISVDLFGPGAPQGIAGKLLSYNLETDVALVRIRTSGRVEVVPVAPPDYRVRRDDPVVSVGCDHGDPPTPRESRVTNLNKFRGPANLQVAGQPVTGRSGGGLFTAEGLVIGVCNAADPEDDEGLYAALPSVYAELDSAGLSRVYEETGGAAAPAASVDGAGDIAAYAAEEPDMPSDMPRAIPRLRTEPVAVAISSETRAVDERGTLSSEEASVVEELARQTGDAEVICIIRPADDASRSEIIVLDRASREFRELLAEARRAAPRDLPQTSLDVPVREKPTAAGRRARQPGRTSPWRPAWRDPSEVARRSAVRTR